MENEKNANSSIEEILKNIEKCYGRGCVMRLGDRPNVDFDAISSGSILLDRCLGVGGYPEGRIIEIFGPESSGKTTLALTAIAECQKKGGMCAFVDAEHTIDPDYAKALGVNIEDLILSQPDYGEQALGIVEELIKSGCFKLIIVDSVAALVPQAELDGTMEDNSVGLQARLMSKAMRKMAGLMNKNGTTVIFINQLREKVGVVYGSNETTTGGRALKFFSTVRIDIRRSEAIKDANNILGNTVNVKVVKNKVAPPFKSCKLDIIYGKGISKEAELLDLAIENKIISKNGSWYDYNGNRIGQGRETAKMFLKENKDIFEEIKQKIITLEK